MPPLSNVIDIQRSQLIYQLCLTLHLFFSIFRENFFDASSRVDHDTTVLQSYGGGPVGFGMA